MHANRSSDNAIQALGITRFAPVSAWTTLDSADRERLICLPSSSVRPSAAVCREDLKVQNWYQKYHGCMPTLEETKLQARFWDMPSHTCYICTHRLLALAASQVAEHQAAVAEAAAAPAPLDVQHDDAVRAAGSCKPDKKSRQLPVATVFE